VSHEPTFPRTAEPNVDAAVVSDPDRTAAVVDTAADPECRQLLAAAGDEPRSVRELGEAAGVPLSTAYRKLGRLAAAGLLQEGTRVVSAGRPPTVYTRVARAASVRVFADGQIEAVLFSQPDDAGSD
jgi:predicted ArsR family transcriptional regulator